MYSVKHSNLKDNYRFYDSSLIEIVNSHKDLVEKLKNYAYTERLTMKEAVNKIIDEALTREEKRLAKQGNEILDRKGGK